MTKEELAARLEGTGYPVVVGPDLSVKARQHRLVIVSGYSDDLMSFEGAIYDELDCYEGGTAYVDSDGLLDRNMIDDDDDDEIANFVLRKRAARTINAIWSDEGPAWTYETEIPHATFEVMDDGEVYCRGIVFSLDDL